MTAAVEAHAVRERPVILREYEARGLRDGSVSVLWREVKPWRGHRGAVDVANLLESAAQRAEALAWAPYGAPGERLWGREAYALENCGDDGDQVIFRADLGAKWRDGDGTVYWLPSDYSVPRWLSPVAMPRWACRTVVEIVDVRVMRPVDLTEERADALLPKLPQGPRRHPWADLFTAQLNPFGISRDTWAWALTVRRLP